MEREILAAGSIAIGDVRCRAGDRTFGRIGRVPAYRVVFPRQSVWIKTGRSRRYISDPTVVEYYNAGDEFAREPLDPRGDHTHWFEIGEAEVRDVLRQYDPPAAEAPLPFRFTHAPTDSRAYLIQRALFSRVLSSNRPGELAVAETVLDVFDRVVARAYQQEKTIRARPVTRDEREIAERAGAVLSQITSGRTPLAAISRSAGVSMFHLSRVFRKVTGATLAAHHRRLRLFASLEPLVESGAVIDDVAKAHGFTGHAHYTWLFRRVFGVTPSEFRRQPSRWRRA
jgi:AraC-like DNA-binding protein